MPDRRWALAAQHAFDAMELLSASSVPPLVRSAIDVARFADITNEAGLPRSSFPLFCVIIRF